MRTVNQQVYYLIIIRRVVKLENVQKHRNIREKKTLYFYDKFSRLD